MWSDTCCQLASPKVTTATAATMATKVSGELAPSASLTWPPKIQASAMSANTTIASTRRGVHGMTSSGTTILRFSCGRNTSHSVNTISGSRISISGKPTFIQPAKSMLIARAAIASGGEPTSVPRPPMLAE